MKTKTINATDIYCIIYKNFKEEHIVTRKNEHLNNVNEYINMQYIVLYYINETNFDFYLLFVLPRLHRHFVLFKLMTPI